MKSSPKAEDSVLLSSGERWSRALVFTLSFMANKITAVPAPPFLNSCWDTSNCTGNTVGFHLQYQT